MNHIYWNTRTMVHACDEHGRTVAYNHSYDSLKIAYCTKCNAVLVLIRDDVNND